MRFGLFDLLIAIALNTIGAVLGSSLSSTLPGYFRLVAILLGGPAVYLVAVCPIYRSLRLLPMVLPRCPCCHQFRDRFQFWHGWPRVIYRCESCQGEFVIWHNGKPAEDETWDRPVLALKCPYAFGRYQRITRPQ